MSRLEMEKRVDEIMGILDYNLYTGEEEENKLRDECEALIAQLNSEEYKEIPRSEMDKYYDEISAQLNKMPRNFALWYLIPSEIKELEEAIKQCGQPRNVRESRMCYVFNERIKVLRQMREELGIGLWG